MGLGTIDHGGSGVVSRLRRFLRSPGFRRQPIRSTADRVRWRLHWRFRRDHPFVVPFFDGTSLELADSSASMGIFLNGDFSDASVASPFVEYLRPGMTAVDCGAHIGEYTALFSRLVGDAGSVHSFEPDPTVFSYLGRNVVRNGLDNVVLNHTAVAAEVGSEAFATHTDPTMSSLVRFSSTLAPAVVEVAVTTLDAYAAANHLHALDALKVDVEGAELAVLQGGRETLAGLRPGVVFVECDNPHGFPDVCDLLRRHGYHLKTETEHHRSPHVLARHPRP